MAKDMEGQLSIHDWMPDACPAVQPKARKKRHRLSEDSYVLCPFYHKDGAIEIRCDGICGRLTTHIFRDKREKEEFKADFCNGNWYGCPLYQALEIDT